MTVKLPLSHAQCNKVAPLLESVESGLAPQWNSRYSRAYDDIDKTYAIIFNLTKISNGIKK